VLSLVDVKLKYLSDKISRPEYATRGSIGFDLSAAIDASFTLKAGEKTLIPSGIAVSIPKGYGGFMFARAGLAARKGIVLAGGAGIIDSDYTGEIKVALINLSNAEYTVKNGERIAQLVIMKVEKADFEPVDERLSHHQARLFPQIFLRLQLQRRLKYR